MSTRGRQAKLSDNPKTMVKLLEQEAHTLKRLRIQPMIQERKMQEAAMIRRINKNNGRWNDG